MQARWVAGVAIIAVVCCTAVYLNEEADASERVVKEAPVVEHAKASSLAATGVDATKKHAKHAAKKHAAHKAAKKAKAKKSKKKAKATSKKVTKKAAVAKKATGKKTSAVSSKATAALPGEASAGHLNKMVKAESTAQTKALNAENVAHAAETLAPVHVHAARVTAEAKELKKQAGIVKKKVTAAGKAGGTALKKEAAAAAHASKVAATTNVKEIKNLYKLEHNLPKKKEEEEKRFIKQMDAVADGAAPPYTDASGKQYQPGHPGYFPKLKLKLGAGSGGHWPNHNVAPTPESMFVTALIDTHRPSSADRERRGAQRVAYAAEQALFEEQVAPRHTKENKAQKAMREAEDVAMARQAELFQETVQPIHTGEEKARKAMKEAEERQINTQSRMYKEALSPSPIQDPIEELTEALIGEPSHMSKKEAIRAAQDAGYAAQESLFEEMAAPRRTTERKAIEEARFAEDVMGEELDRLYEKSLTN